MPSSPSARSPRRLAAVAAGILVAPLLCILAPQSASAAPLFQMPFPCGQVWAGQTRTNHSPANAVDFNRADDDGDPVVSSVPGTVTRVENTGSTSYGRWIEIDHGGGWRTRYAHLSVQRVSVGQGVGQGQLIGNVGNTGGSTGPHLHFEERLNGSAARISFNGAQIYYWGTRNYTSRNACSGGGNATVSTSGAPLNVRSEPRVSATKVGELANGTRVTISCYRRGDTVTGTFGTSDIWDYIPASRGYVSDTYLYTGSDQPIVPAC